MRLYVYALNNTQCGSTVWIYFVKFQQCIVYVRGLQIFSENQNFRGNYGHWMLSGFI